MKESRGLKQNNMPQSRPIIEWYKLIPDPEIREKSSRDLDTTLSSLRVDDFQDALIKGIRDELWDEEWDYIYHNIAPTWPIPEKVSEVNEAVEFLDWVMRENVVQSAYKVNKWGYNSTDYTALNYTKYSKQVKPKAMKLNKEETMYVPIGKNGHMDYTCVRCQRKMCVEAFLKGSGMTWAECKKYGWCIIKVKVLITETN